MNSDSFDLYKVIDPSKRDAVWMDSLITNIRRFWTPLVNQYTNAANKNLLFSRQSMAETVAMFKADGEFMKTQKILPLPIMELVMNIIVEEIRKNPPAAQLSAIDPLAVSDKKADIFKLQNRKAHENNINKNRVAVGLPTYKVPKEDFNSNVEDFDKMNMDDTDPDDINFYEQNYQRLTYEIAGQTLINTLMKLNRFDTETVKKFVIDILSDLVICMQVYVDQITGEIKYDYLYPETFYGLFGKTNDGKDDISKGYMKSVTVNEWMQNAGNSFDWDNEWRQLLWAINYRNGYTYTGFRRNNLTYDCCGNPTWMTQMGLQNTAPNILEWNIAYTYEVFMGYIEIKMPEITGAYKVHKTNKDDITSTAPDYHLSEQEEKQGYATETFYQQQMYGSYFIATSSVSQWIYGWGKVYMQGLEGANDEYCSGTLWYYRDEGKSAVELVLPYLTLANQAFYKMVWAVYEAHPDWEVYQVEELAELAQVMYKQAATTGTPARPLDMQTQLKKIVEYFRQNLVKFRAVPRIDGKKRPDMNTNMPTKEQRGLDPIAIAMQSVSLWAEQQVMSKLGINDMRQGNIANPREGYKQNVAETQYSMNTTGYVYRMIQYMKERIATTSLQITQDVIKYKDSIPYKWILRLLGDEGMQHISVLDKYSVHRYALIVLDKNTAERKQQIKDAANLALDKSDGRGGITLVEWGIVMDKIEDDDYRSALKALAFFKEKQEKKLRRQALQDQQLKAQNDQQLKQMDMQMEQLKSQTLLQGKNIDADAIKYSADKQYASKVDTKNIQVNAEPQKEQAKANAEKEKLQNEAEIKTQESLIHA